MDGRVSDVRVCNPPQFGEWKLSIDLSYFIFFNHIVDELAMNQYSISVVYSTDNTLIALTAYYHFLGCCRHVCAAQNDLSASLNLAINIGCH